MLCLKPLLDDRRLSWALQHAYLHIALPGPACELALCLQLRKLGCIVCICTAPSAMKLHAADLCMC